MTSNGFNSKIRSFYRSEGRCHQSSNGMLSISKNNLVAELNLPHQLRQPIREFG